MSLNGGLFRTVYISICEGLLLERPNCKLVTGKLHHGQNAQTPNAIEAGECGQFSATVREKCLLIYVMCNRPFAWEAYQFVPALYTSECVSTLLVTGLMMTSVRICLSW